MHRFPPTLLSLALLVPAEIVPAETMKEVASERDRDLLHFRQVLLEKEASFSADARDRAQKLLARLQSEANTMSAAELELGLAEIVALADNGHTLLLNPRWTRDYNRLPVSFLIVEDELYVARSPENPALEGSVVLSIGGRTFPELEDAWATYQGGEPGWRREFLYFFVESPQMLHAAGLIESADHVALRLGRPGREPESVTLAARRDLEPLRGLEAYLPPARVLFLTRDADGEGKPLYLRDPRRLFHYEPLDGGRVAYVRMRSTTSSDTERISDFISTTRKRLRDQPPRAVILDLRHNTGGDLNNARSFMRFLPEIVGEHGKVVALTSGRTFSAAISSLGYLKQAGGERVVIVGEPVGDRLEFWAEGGLVELPHSGVAFIHATERHNYRTGCPEDDCHGSIKRHPIRVRSLQPDHLVAPTWESFASGRDPLLARAMGLLADARTHAQE